jgi:hypothetical protein
MLHITNGDSVADTLRLTSLGGWVLAWRDVLNEGPVPAVGAAELREARARFLSECGWGGEIELLLDLERRDGLLDEVLAAKHRIVLWFEHDLYDQLQLLQILAYVGDEPDRIELVNPGRFLGELDADQLEEIWEERRPVGSALLELGRRGWSAFTAAEPTAIESFLWEDSVGLPFLAAALRRLLEQLPDRATGLSRSERQLLEALAGGPMSPLDLFVESQKREEAPFDGDSWVWRRAWELGSGRRPLVALVDGAKVPPPPPIGSRQAFAAVELALTETGANVLAGRADAVRLRGIDRWLGGTHLTPEGVWRWDADAGRVVSP